MGEDRASKKLALGKERRLSKEHKCFRSIRCNAFRWSHMRDRPLLIEHCELELPSLGAASRLDNSKITGDASKPFPGDFIFDGNKKYSECFS